MTTNLKFLRKLNLKFEHFKNQQTIKTNADQTAAAKRLGLSCSWFGDNSAFINKRKNPNPVAGIFGICTAGCKFLSHLFLGNTGRFLNLPKLQKPYGERALVRFVKLENLPQKSRNLRRRRWQLPLSNTKCLHRLEIAQSYRSSDRCQIISNKNISAAKTEGVTLQLVNNIVRGSGFRFLPNSISGVSELNFGWEVVA